MKAEHILPVVKEQLKLAMRNIDAGNSNLTEEQLTAVIDALSAINNGIPRLSKRHICQRWLHCAPSTFDTYLRTGLIPPGKKRVGFKELAWSVNDIKEALEYRGLDGDGRKARK